MIKAILKSIKLYREKTYNIEALQASIRGNYSAMEGDIPEDIRNKLQSMEGELEIIRFTTESKDQVEKLLIEFEELLKNR